MKSENKAPANKQGVKRRKTAHCMGSLNMLNQEEGLNMLMNPYMGTQSNPPQHSKEQHEEKKV